MTQPDFTLALEQELQLRGIPFSRADLLAFVASVWPLAQDEPDPVTWANLFLAATAAPTIA
jgi:hypothetical protein